MGRKLEDLNGQRFGMLIVIERTESRRKASGGLVTYWNCKCDCGNKVKARADKLKLGKIVSCGCKVNDRNLKHGKSRTRLYNIYNGIIERCCNSKNPNYKNYGGRGIKICNEWLEDFMNFYNWAIDNGYQENLSIDRIDVNGNYEPSNCRWATAIEQANNKRPYKLYEYKGEKRTLKSICKELKVSYTTIWKRINNGMSLEEALDVKQQKNRK